MTSTELFKPKIPIEKIKIKALSTQDQVTPPKIKIFRRALFRFSQALFIAFTNPFSYTTTPLINSVAFYKEYKFIYPSITKMLQSKCKWECIYIYLYYKWAWCWVGWVGVVEFFECGKSKN